MSQTAGGFRLSLVAPLAERAILAAQTAALAKRASSTQRNITLVYSFITSSAH